MPTFIKTPSEIYDYGFDWDDGAPDALESAEIISTSNWDLGGLTQDSADEVNSAKTETKCWLTGGEVDTDYTITNTIETDQGRTLQRSHIIKIVEAR